ncbi:hypothetical protein Hypma_009786 [Hypsizygus marmoreus]|uniref:Chromo domain-containing protein n=1 Tax=Hypsizygus marmoreus TaxID=39966 RepID=A0A369JMC6_HYPMA|nr:hypothetical protein Hypma_009786 [Hypsizygus marmoreus]
MTKRKRKTSEPEPELYEVEALLRARVTRVRARKILEGNGEKSMSKKNSTTQVVRWEYLVKWVGYDTTENSWEPEEGVKRCRRLLAEFWDAVVTDKEIYEVGDEVEPSEERKLSRKGKARGVNGIAHSNGSVDSQPAQRETGDEGSDDLVSEYSVISPHFSPSTVRRLPKRKSNSKLAENHTYDDGKRFFIRLPPRLPSRKESVVVSESSDDDIPLDELESPRKKMKADVPNRSPMSESQPQMTYGHHGHLFSEPSSPEGSPAPDLSYLPPASPPRMQQSAKATVTAGDPRRRVDPHVRITERTPGNNTSAPGIPTKQRLAQGALAPRKPKSVSLFIPKPRPQVRPIDSHSYLPTLVKDSAATTQNATLGRRSFDVTGEPQRSLPTHPTLSAKEALTLSEINARGRTPYPEDFETNPSSSLGHDGLIDNVEPSMLDQFPPTMLSPPTFWPVEATSIVPEQALVPNVNSFIITPPPSPDTERHPYNYSRAVIPVQRTSYRSIPHGWAWSGTVYLGTSQESSNRLCNAIMCDSTAPPPQGLDFGIVLSSFPQLAFSRFYDLTDTGTILRACQILQFARLAPHINTDAEPLQTLAKYMTRKRQIFFFPVCFRKEVGATAQIIFFPPDTQTSEWLRPPSEVQKQGSLVAALVTWSLPLQQQLKDWRKPLFKYLPATDTTAFLEKEHWDRSVLTKSLFHHALCILKFPRELLHFMSTHNHGYYVWYDGGDGSKRRPGMETCMLHAITEQCRAKKPGNIAEVRVIFVHVGAVKTLHRLSGFHEFCSKLFHVHFYTYGTHETIAPEYWGVHEIYPCGGVVTFTPRALTNDPVGVLHRISQIHSHPLWACYILPSVLGMVMKSHSEYDCIDPTPEFYRDNFPYHSLLSAVDNGEIALLTAPQSLTKSRDPRGEWVHDHFTHRPQEVQSMLQSSVNTFNSRHGNMQPAQIELSIRAEISSDLISMRQQPALMEKYRRYIVIDSNSDHARRSDGLEWTSIDEFDFKDDFFPKN